MKTQQRGMGTLGLGAFGLFAVALLFASSPSAHAQTTANGPYYPMPAWDQTLPATTRFTVLSNFAGEAVLDRETGLVWERAPAGSATWVNALAICAAKTVGNRMGWRLPTIQELASLIDRTISFPKTALPAGHPFVVSDPPSNVYWSATTAQFGPNHAWSVLFINLPPEAAQNPVVAQGKPSASLLWCVRGGYPVDPQ